MSVWKVRWSCGEVFGEFCGFSAADTLVSERLRG
jgi:hypothetical protein